MTRTSSISGTFSNRQRSPVRHAAASSFRAAFFAPRPCTVPLQRPAALDPERLRGRRLRGVLPVERPGVSHGRSRPATGALPVAPLRDPDPEQRRAGAAARAAARSAPSTYPASSARSASAAPPGPSRGRSRTPRSAVSAITTTLSGRTWRNPPAIAKLSSLAALADLQLPDPEQAHERRVVRQDPELAVDARARAPCRRRPRTPAAPASRSRDAASLAVPRTRPLSPSGCPADSSRLRRLRAPRALRSPAIRPPTRPLGQTPHSSSTRDRRPERRGVPVREEEKRSPPPRSRLRRRPISVAEAREAAKVTGIGPSGGRRKRGRRSQATHPSSLAAFSRTSSRVPARKNACSGSVSALPSRISLNEATVSLIDTYLPGAAGEHLGDRERLAHEPLQAAGAGDRRLVLLGQLVDARGSR